MNKYMFLIFFYCLIFGFSTYGETAKKTSVKKPIKLSKTKAMEAPFSRRSFQLIGYFIKVPKPAASNVGEVSYYLLVESDDLRKLAYPVEVSDRRLLKLIESHLDKQFLIQARAFQKQVQKREFTGHLTYLRILDGAPIELSQLGVKHAATGDAYELSSDISLTPSPHRKGESRISGINDNVTNASIFTAGAVLLASILLGGK